MSQEMPNLQRFLALVMSGDNQTTMTLEVVTQGSPVMQVEYFESSVEIKQAGCDRITVDNPLIAGESYAITFDYGTMSSSQVSGYKEALGSFLKRQMAE